MATDDQLINIKRAAGDGITAKVRVTKKATITVSGNSTVKQNFVLPAGSDLRAVTLDTPTAISGTPTSCLFRAGTADAGQEVVAAVDAKAQGHITCTIVAALDKGAACASADTTIYTEVITSGGSSSAGNIEAFIDYDAPTF